MRRSIGPLTLAFLLVTKIASAQQSAPLPPFNQPVSCPDNLNYIVESCQPWGPEERCIYRSERNGELVNRANTWRSMLSEKLKDCKQVSRPAAGTQAQPSRPAAGGAQSTNTSYLSKLPPVERVMREVQGKDPLDTAAKQSGAFWLLRNVIISMAHNQRRNENNLAPEEQRLSGEYYAAYSGLWKTVSDQVKGDGPTLFKLGGYAHDGAFKDELLGRLCAPGFRDEYWQAEGKIAGRVRARLEEDKAIAKQAEADRENAAKQQGPKPWQRELSRCIASGRSESQCFTESLSKGAGDWLPGLKQTPRPSGLYLSGVYTGQGGFSVMFHPNGAWVGCKQVREVAAGYAVDTKSDQVAVRLLPDTGAGNFLGGIQAMAPLRRPKPGENPEEWQGQRITFSVRPDGKLVGSGPIQVTGQVPVGQTTQQTTTEQKRIQPFEAQTYNPAEVKRDAVGLYVEQQVTTSVPVYAEKTERCTLGPLTLDPSASASVNVSQIMGSVLGSVLGVGDKTATKPTPLGFRVHGKYAGEDGVDIEFHPESAVVGCREAVVAREYSVSTSGNRVLVNIQNGASPISLELRRDGTMAGSGPVSVNSRRVASVKQRIEGTRNVQEPVFEPVADTCTLGVLTPEGPRANAGAPTSTAAAPAPTRQPSSTPATRPNVAAGTGGTGTLSLASGIAPEPGDSNPLDGAPFILAKESLESVLRKAGLQPSAGESAIKLWQKACESRQPLCQQGFARLLAVGVGRVKLDAKGKAQFPALPAGTYYLVGSGVYDDRQVLWDLRIDIKPGANSVTLDQRNAVPIN